MNTFAIGSLPVHFSVAKLFTFRWQYTYIKTNLNKVCQLNFNKAFEESRRILESKPSKETFESELSEILTNNIKIHLHNQVLQIKNVKLEMWGNDSDDKTELLELGVCPIRMTKHIVEQWPAGDVRYYLQNVPEITYSGRYPFIIPVIPVHFFVSKDRYLLRS